MIAVRLDSLGDVANHFAVDEQALTRALTCPAWCSRHSVDLTDGTAFHRHTEVLDAELEVEVELCVMTDGATGVDEPLEVQMRFGQEPPFTLAEAEHALEVVTKYVGLL